MFKFIVVLAVLGVTLASRKGASVSTCRQGEVLQECGCDLNCQNRDALCKGVCYPEKRCFCAPGYVRNRSKKCIPKESCPSCDKIREKQQCKDRNARPVCSGCERICEPVQQSCDPIPVFTYPVCHCIEGYLRFPDGTCKPENDCMVRG